MESNEHNIVLESGKYCIKRIVTLSKVDRAKRVVSYTLNKTALNAYKTTRLKKNSP